MQNPDDFLYDKFFQPISEYADIEYDINHNQLASFFYKATAMFMIVTSFVEFFWSDKHPIVVFVFGYMAVVMWRWSVTLSKKSTDLNGAQNSSRIKARGIILRYFLTFAIVYMTVVTVLDYFSMIPSWAVSKYTEIPIFIFCLYVVLWAAEYFEGCNGLPPSVKQARQARKLTTQTA